MGDKRFFLTLDLEEWYHLEYLKGEISLKKDLMLNELTAFFDLLDRKNIKITVFVLGELIALNKDLIKKIYKSGHEIGIHGWDHELLNRKSNEVFEHEINRAKVELEKLTQEPILGYRAPCFSMDNYKLDILKKIGLVYDSSYIKFKDHPLYGNLNISKFDKIDDLVYKKDKFYEFEIPTIKILGKNIPISGGGYFRLFPKWVFSILWRKYNIKHRNFIFYIHPFELTDKKVTKNNFSFINKFRFSYGRRNNLNKLEWFLDKAIKNNFEFVTIKHYINYCKDVS